MKLQKGFTLVELMIVVVIVAILSVVALPAYNNYTIRGKIPDATANLATKRVAMEQYFQDNRTYTIGGGACPASVAPDSTSSAYFRFTCVATPPPTNTYTITATGRTTKSMGGFTYTIDQGNNKQTTAAPSGWATATMPASCWITKPGAC